MRFPSALLIPSLLLMTGPISQAADWPQFLGPHRDGISDEQGVNLDWTKSVPKVAWKVPLGVGFGSVIVVDGHLYTMAQRGDRDYVLCFDADSGKELWKLDAAPGFIDTWQKQGAGPRATPIYEDGKLYCQMSDGTLLCVTAKEGKIDWRTNIFEAAGTRDPNGKSYFWGLSASPLVEGKLVIVQPGGDRASVLALDKATGKVVWKAGSDPAGYASPIAITVDKTRQLVVPTGQSILGLEPETGKILWRYAFGNRFNANCATPLWANDLLFVSAAYRTGCAALSIKRTADGWDIREQWRNHNLENIFGTSVILEGHVYGHNGDLGAITLRCLDLKTGELKWTERERGRSTLIAVEGHLIILDKRGSLRVARVTPQSQAAQGELRDLLKMKAWAAPALARGRLYLRDQNVLMCLDLRAR